MPSHVEMLGRKKSPSSVLTAPQERCVVFLLLFREERLLTGTDDFLLGDVARVDFLCELVHGCVGVLVCVRVHISLQRFQLFYRNRANQIIRAILNNELIVG